MRWIVSLLLVAVLGGLAWLALARAPGPTDTIGRGSVGAPAEASAGEASAPGDLLSPPPTNQASERASALEQSAAAPEAEAEAEPLEPGGLRVLVVDASGAPAPGVEVTLNLKVRGMGEDDRGRETTRAPDGLARIELSDLDQFKQQVTAMGVKVEFAVAARIASAEPVEMALDAWPMDGMEVELVLPATGAVRVHVVHADGRPVDGEVSLGWWWLPADVAAADPNAGYERVKRHFVDGPGGLAQIDGIGLGLALHLQASLQGYMHASERGLAGPTEPGEVIDVTMTLGEPVASLQVRVLDPAGVPLANQKLWAEQWDDPERERHPASGPPRGHGFPMTTDELGVATFTRAPGEVTIDRRLDVTRGSRGSTSQSDSDWGLGSAWLPRVLESGEVHDLGDARLEPARVLVEGHVVDESGAPVARVDLRFQVRHGSTPQHGWTNLESLRTDSEGHFRLRGVRTPLELGVLVYRESYKGQTLHGLEIGDTAMLIELEPESSEPQYGSIALEVLMDEDVPFMRCLLKFERTGGGGRSPDWWAGAPIEIDRLKPGTYDVFVETRDGDFELERVSGVVVAAGETTRDARLAPFDVRGTAQSVSLRVVRPDDSPWRRRSLTVAAIGHGRSFWAKTDDTGTVDLILPRAVTSIQVALDETHTVLVSVPASADDPIRVELAE